jgi:predicted Zn-dependent protease
VAGDRGERIQTLRGLLARDPKDAMTRYMLATELYKNGDYEQAVDEMESYLKQKEDEGAAYRILADAYLKLGKSKEARWVLRQGIEAARSHHHDGMADEFEDRLKEMG